MEPEIAAIFGVAILLLSFAAFIYWPGVTLRDAQNFYNKYIDWMVVSAASLIAVLVLAGAAARYIASGNPSSAYLAAAAATYLIKEALVLVDEFTPGSILLPAMANVLDLAILGFLYAAVSAGNGTD